MLIYNEEITQHVAQIDIANKSKWVKMRLRARFLMLRKHCPSATLQSLVSGQQLYFFSQKLAQHRVNFGS